MSRIARILLKCVCYHIINRGNQKQNIFLDNIDCEKYMDILRHYKRKYRFKLYAYCLMPNHIHLIIEIKDINDLAKIMQCITQTYTAWFNKKYKKTGRLWQNRFKSMIIQKDRYLLDCLRYIELNPIRAKITSFAEQYSWCSWKERSLGVHSNSGKLLDILRNLKE